MTDVVPNLSILVTSTAPLQDASACILALTQQCRGRQVQIIVTYGSDEESHETTAADYPDVIFIRLPQAASLPQLLGAAIAQATGDIIAITDAGCAIDARWVSAVVKAHEEPHPVIGGSVEPGGLRTLVDWAAYFCDYGQFMLPLTRGLVSEIPGNNLSIKRWALARGREYVDEEFWKTYWCRQLQMEGLHLSSAPSMVVHYGKPFRLWPYLVHRFHNGRCFAGMRNAQLTPPKRVLHWAGSPILPILFCARILRIVLPKQRCRHQLVLSFPFIALATISWACGEFCGYFLGCGASCRHVR